MLSSAIPTLVPLPFANSGTKNAIPTASQIGITPGAASLTDGFPPLTFTPISAGGIPPAGADFNGILNLLSANTQWENAGGFYPYNSAFSTSIGGYPKGALLAMASGTGFWLSAADNNTVNPESGPSANWIAMSPNTTQSGAYNYAADTGAANAYVVTLKPAPTAYAAGMIVSFVAGNANTGASTLNVNGLGVKNLTKKGATALAAGDILAGQIVSAEYDGTQFQIINPSAIAPAFRAHAAIDQSITAGVDTKVTLGTVDFDTASNFSSSRFTATVAGYYQFNGTVRAQATNLTGCSCYLYKNGVLNTQGVLIIVSSTSGDLKSVVSDVIYLAIGDYVELYGNLAAGTSPIFKFSTTGGASSLSGCLVRPA